MRCLVTGGAGFIGSHLAQALVGRGHEVRVLDNLSTGSRENLASCRADLELIEGDVQDAAASARAFAGVEAVFHLAALPSVHLSIQEPLRAHAMNATATLAALQAAVEARARRFVFASSSSVYGHGGDGPATEGQLPHPLSPYAAQKLIGEHYARIFGEIHGLETVSLRYFNVFGPRQDPSSPYSGVISIFCERLMSGEVPTIYGDGEQTRDFTYVDNVVDANLLCLGAKVPPGTVVNVATGTSISINELYNRVSRLCGVTHRAQHAPARPGDVRHSRAAIAEARRLLGYEPRSSFEPGLARTVSWYQDRMRARLDAPSGTK